ncbi:SDR family NAD(P)-dependent oxidoreductase [Mucilaginibacter calamicampi]|uniref:SDR family NAD(P)-dependent oxidoreductase n=1 Tax=Mucilaginibacter calamicampi TaxID=1302352 RepID=A0ABW2YT74_9SPHI
MKNILITGGAGFIGTNVSRQLIKQGFNVTVFDNFSPQIHGDVRSLPADIMQHVELIVGDVTDKEAFYAALKNKHAVIHLAAETGTGQSMYDVSRYTLVNIQATAILCDYIINESNEIKTVIVASSRSIYGEGKYHCDVCGDVYPAGRTFATLQENFEVTCPKCKSSTLNVRATDEDSKIHPSSYYGITKQVQEQMVILAAKMKAINGFALRYQNVYGPGQSLNNPYTGILSIFSRLAIGNEDINIFEDGNESRDFVFINDVVNATVSCLRDDIKGQHILNVGTGLPVSVMEVATEIVSFFASSSKLKVSGAFREGDIRHNFSDLKKISQVMQFVPEWKFIDGLHAYLNWVKQQKLPEDTKDYEKSLAELEERGLLNG